MTGVDSDDSSVGLWPMAAMGSVAIALYYYYVRDEKQRGQFIGLWPATILGLAVYIKLDQVKKLLQQSAD